MHAIGLWFHNTFFHAWHFLYNQVQLTNWFGNVVAGVAVWFVVTLLWKWFVKRWITEAVRKIHAEELARHHREVVLPILTKNHNEALKLAKEHHAFHIAQNSAPALPKRDAKGHFLKREP
jgi:hypothetical protein